MTWIILDLVFLVVTYLSLRGIVIEEYHGKQLVGETRIPVWALLVLGMLYIIPIIGIVIFIAYHIIFIICLTKEPERYKDKYILKLSSRNILHRILGTVINFLNKDI